MIAFARCDKKFISGTCGKAVLLGKLKLEVKSWKIDIVDSVQTDLMDLTKDQGKAKGKEK